MVKVIPLINSGLPKDFEELRYELGRYLTAWPNAFKTEQRLLNFYNQPESLKVHAFKDTQVIATFSSISLEELCLKTGI